MANSLSAVQMSAIIEAAGAAPSIHNSQPWQFAARADGAIELHGQIDRALRVCDPHARSLYQSCGAALFNLRLAIRVTGHDARVRLLPHPEYPFSTLAVIQPGAGRPPTAVERGLYDAIWRRHTNRGPFADRIIPAPVHQGMVQAAHLENATLRWLDWQSAAAVLTAAGQAGQELAADAPHELELQRWIASGSSQDGIPAGALPSRPASRPSPVRIDDFLAVVPAAARPKATYEEFPQLAVLTTERDEPEDWLQAGQALQSVLLTATLNGVSASFLGQPLELMDMRQENPPSPALPESLQMIIRCGYGPPAAATPRRPLSDLVRQGAFACGRTRTG